jgi:ABC-type transport system involved in cytochrome bd biosynthesis fused ATPase/permease subunit
VSDGRTSTSVGSETSDMSRKRLQLDIIDKADQIKHLIDDSVRRNVAYGVPDAEIDNERVARLRWIVWCALLGELDAIVGERGGRLSGRERQRLGSPEPSMATRRSDRRGDSNLDPVTEAAIVEVVAGLRANKTIIVIAHRLAFVRNCDCIFLLAQGRSHLRAVLGVACERPGFFGVLRDRLGGRLGTYHTEGLETSGSGLCRLSRRLW